MSDTKSRTERDTTVVERIITGGHHYKTTISDGTDCVVGLGSTPEQAEDRASDKWQEKKDK